MLGIEYTAVYSKVKSWMSKMIKEEEISQLMRKDLQDILNLLKERTKKIEINTDDIIQIEGLLKQESYNYLMSGIRFLSGKAKAFIQEWSRYYEIENLKIITRSLLNHKNIDFLYELSTKSKIRMELVKDLRNLDEFQDFLSGSIYYRLAVDSLPRVKEESRTFYFEMNLDNFFAMNINKKLSGLSVTDKKDVKDILLYYLQMKRLKWIYRAKFSYKLTAVDILSMIPNVFSYLNDKEYETLAQAENEAVFITFLKEHRFIISEKGAEANLEKEINIKTYQRVKKALCGTPFRLGVFTGFIIAQTFNVRKMIALLESRRLKVDPGKVSETIY